MATGGGVVLRPENRERLRAAGRIIWLAAEPQTLWKRVQQDLNTMQRRPDLSRARKLLDWQPRTSLEAGLVKTIGYFRERLR